MNDKRTALYRHFAGDGTLLYVGISLNHFARLAQHRAGSSWYDEISRVEIEWHPDRESALEAEKAAIQTERPVHNVIHARFGARQVAAIADSPAPDDFPSNHPWPIPAKFAVIGWELDGPALGCEDGIGAVGIGYQPWRCKSPQWIDMYEMTCGAGDSSRDELSNDERRIAVLSDYFMLTQVYGIDPRVATQAFLNIQEFRDAITSSPMGQSLIDSDLPYIAKSDPRPEQRYWHSVHVFPRDVRLEEAA